MPQLVCLNTEITGRGTPQEFAFFRHGLMVATMAGALCGRIGL